MDYDVVVIGSGIHGAGAAQAAAAAGYRVLLLEQYRQPAQGTSSRSSKLIHGGLRYLETGQFKLVHECLRERAILLKNAPHLVRLESFRIPIYRETRRRPWQILLGLMLYSILSGKPFHYLPRRRWQDLDGLRCDNLQALFSYYDGITDDARLTRAVLASAQSLGAEIRYEARFEEAWLEDNHCRVHYRTRHQSEQIESRVLINTAGPWANQVLARVVPAQSPAAVELVQGTHIRLPAPLKRVYYLEAPEDGRAVFVIPWRGETLVGTTETPYHGDPAKVQPLPAEIDYLLSIYNHYFSHSFTTADIQEAFAGLRVLPAGRKPAFARPRDTMIITDRPDQPRIVSLFGGKLTAYRATAEILLRRLSQSLPAPPKRISTRNLALPEVE